MANKQTLPGMADTQRGFINTQGSPTMPSINWQSPLRGVAGVMENVADFEKSYADLRYEEYEAKYSNLASQMYHEMDDATDPCQLQDIKNKYDKSFSEPMDDTMWAKSYNQSTYKKKWVNTMNTNYEKVYLKKMHEFTGIQLERTLNEMSSTAALTGDPRAAASYFDAGMVNIGNRQHLTAEEKHKMQKWYAENFVGKLYTSDPNFALSFTDLAGDVLDKYGIDRNEIKTKTQNYNLAMLRRRREEERYQDGKLQKARKSVVAAAKAQIIQQPDKADAIIADMPDNESFVEVSDWYRKGLGKDTSKAKSPLSQSLVDYIKENGMDSVEEWMNENPEYINDTDARTAVNQALSQVKKEESDVSKEVKKELSALDTKEKFEKYMDDAAKATQATVYANEAVKNLRKKYGLEDEEYVESYIADLNSRKDSLSENDIKAERVRVRNDSLLSNADKNKVYKVLDSFATKAEKTTDKELKAQSTQALNNIRLIENNGSGAIEKAIIDNATMLNGTDMGRALELRNAALRREGKESATALKEADKKMQGNLYTALLREINENGYSDTDAISDFENNGLLTSAQSGKLLKAIYDKRDKQVVQAQKDLDKNALLQIYDAERKNELPPTISELGTDNPQVIKERNRIANKVAKDRYNAEKAIIKGEIYKELPATREDFDDYVSRLSSLNYIGNEESPEAVLQDIVSKAQKIPEGNRKYISDTLYSYMPKPLVGKNYSNYELNLRNQALDEALSLYNEGKAYNLAEIANKYMPTKEGYMQAVFDKDNAYYSMLGERNNIFETLTVKDTKAGTSSTSYLVKKNISASDYINYEQKVRGNREQGYYTDTEYKELYKPVAVNKAYIYNTLAENKNTLEERVAYKLKGLYGGKYINDIDGFANDFWNCLSYVEQQVDKQRTDEYGSFANTGEGNIGQLVKQWFKNQYSQANGTIAE